MRTAVWLLGLFAVASAVALFAGSNPGTVTLFWPPWRLDMSLNLFVCLLVAVMLALHVALRTIAAMFDIPKQAQRWRLQQKERALQGALIDSMWHLTGGRFIRARKSAELVVSLEASVRSGGVQLPYGSRVRALAHVLAAEGAHALQDRGVRDAHLQQAFTEISGREAQDMRDGVQLRAARWAFDDRDPARALELLDQLPQGAARRTVALRLRFKAARLAGRSLQALEMARLLTKHRAFTEVAGRSIARGLAIECLRSAHEPVQLERAWAALEPAEQQLPDVAMQAAQRLLELGGSPALSRTWLLPVWEAMQASGDALNASQRVRLVRILESGFGPSGSPPDTQWLSRIETAQMANPRSEALQYLAGVVCMRLGLWGKAQQLLKQSLVMAQDPGLTRDAWCALAELAERRQDSAAAAEAYRKALGVQRTP